MKIRKKSDLGNPPEYLKEETGPHCPVTGKRSHKTRESAKASRKRLKMNGHTDLRVYRCPHPECEHYHVGHHRIHGNLTTREEHREMALRKPVV